MRMKRFLMMCLCCILMVVAFLGNVQYANAETKQAYIASVENGNDLAVMFRFDSQVVPITFIAPSGARFDAGTAGVLYETDQLWATYRIVAAEEGDWSVEYDLGPNSEIKYSVIDDNLGIWFESLDVVEMNGTSATLKFLADSDKDMYYSYRISAISTTDPGVMVQLTSGSASVKDEIVVEVDLSNLQSDKYVFRVDLTADYSGVELFDSIVSDEKNYNNPNEPEGIEDFKVYVDSYRSEILVDWSEYGGYDVKLLVLQDGELIYSGELNSNNRTSYVLYSSDAKELKIQVSLKQYDIYTKPCEKTIDLTKEYLKLDTKDVTGEGQATFSYKAAGEKIFDAKVNEYQGSYRLEGEDHIFFQLESGQNTVSGYFEGEDNVFYSIQNVSIYYDDIPPSIRLYEDLDGKTFYAQEANVIGKVSDCDILKVNGEEKEIGDKGEFKLQIPLNEGENVVNLEALDVNGNSTKMSLTLYKGNKSALVADEETPVSSAKEKSVVEKFLPLIISGIASVIIIILALIFMKKKEDKKFSISPVPFILLGLLSAGATVYTFIEKSKLADFMKSLDFLELAEKSASKAVEYMDRKVMFDRFFIIGLIATAVCVAITVVIIVIKNLVKKHKNKKTVEKPVEKTVEKPAEKTVETVNEKTVENAAETTAEKPAENTTEENK